MGKKEKTEVGSEVGVTPRYVIVTSIENDLED